MFLKGTLPHIKWRIKNEKVIQVSIPHRYSTTEKSLQVFMQENLWFQFLLGTVQPTMIDFIYLMKNVSIPHRYSTTINKAFPKWSCLDSEKVSIPHRYGTT